MRIALSGKMTSGKSLVAYYLTERYGFKQLSFAARMKEIAAELFPRARYSKDRLLLIQVGERLREIDINVWVRYVVSDIKLDEDAVVSDMRFPNEYGMLRRLNFVLVRMHIDRPSQEAMVKKIYPDMPMVLMEDYSETALDTYPFDYTIENGELISLEEVYAQVDNMLKEEGHKRAGK